METGGKGLDEQPTWDQVRLVQTTSAWNSLAQEFKTLQGQIGVDWRLGATDTFSVSAQYRSYALPITRSVRDSATFFAAMQTPGAAPVTGPARERLRIRALGTTLVGTEPDAAPRRALEDASAPSM